MAAVALSTSAAALTASPAPAPAQTPQTPGVFAKLVAGAKPDGKAAQDGPNADASTDPETDATSGSEATTLTAPDGEAKDSAADQPADLRAEIEAMVAAAGQLGVSQPAPVQVATSVPADASPTGEPAAISATASSIATTVALAPATTLPGTAATPTTLPAAAPADPVPARAAPVDALMADTPPADVTPTDAADLIPTEATDPGTAKPAKKSGDIAALLTSLKSAFQTAKGKDVVAAAITDIAIPTPPTAAMAPLNAAPIPADAPAVSELAPPAAAVAENVAAATTPVITPEAEKAAAKPTEAPSIEPDNSLDPAAAPTAAATPDRSRTAAEKVVLPADTAQPAGDAPAPPPTDPVLDAAPAAALPVESGAAPASTPSVGVAESTDIAPAGPSQAEQSLTRHLDLARDNQWLDRLARDISAAATQQGHLKFQLNPEHLGALTVEIANSAAGTAIRLTADTDQARNILADAQPRLLAEVRAQGLRVAESHVDLNQQGGGSSASAQGQQRQSSEDHKPFARTQAPMRGDVDDSTPHDDGELYA